MKADKSEVLERIRKERIIAIFHADADTGQVLEAVRELRASGIRVFEITTRVCGAEKLIGELSRDGDICVGAGTVLDMESASRLIDAGAKFIVSPVFLPEVVALARSSGVLSIAGALTPSEIFGAHRGGADAVKVFPASFFGASYIRAVMAPLGPIPLIPTGGVTAEDAAGYVEAGAIAVGAGSDLIDLRLLRERDWDALREKAREYIRNLAGFREAG